MAEGENKSRYKLWVEMECHLGDEINTKVSEPMEAGEDIESLGDAVFLQCFLSDLGQLAADNPKYLQGPVACPQCGSADISGESVTIEVDSANQRVSCSDCEAVWEDHYRLVSYTLVEAGNAAES